jgi:hypothetical protein
LSLSQPKAANLQPTTILDFEQGEMPARIRQLQDDSLSARAQVQRAHQHLMATLRPVYDLNERQAASITLRNQQGSCSQRMACLEALARGFGVPTRVHAFSISGRFWYPRFTVSRLFIPKRILLVWPQFFLEESWVDFSELYVSLPELANKSAGGFTNNGESLFEAIKDTPIDFAGKTCGLQCAKPEQDLSRFVLADMGVYDARDEIFSRFALLQDTIRGRMFKLLLAGRRSM